MGINTWARLVALSRVKTVGDDEAWLLLRTAGINH